MRRLVLMLALVACAKSDKKTTTERQEAAVTTAKDDPCSAAALRLTNVKPLEAWKLPEGCTMSGNLTLLVTSQDQARAVLGCTAPLAFDFAKQALVVTSRMLSPASIGVIAYDDGKTVTLVTKQRRPRAGEHPPMPIPAVYAFVVGSGERAFAEANCTID